jgi:hypothetical protein
MSGLSPLCNPEIRDRGRVVLEATVIGIQPNDIDLWIAELKRSAGVPHVDWHYNGGSRNGRILVKCVDDERIYQALLLNVRTNRINLFPGTITRLGSSVVISKPG